MTSLETEQRITDAAQQQDPDLQQLKQQSPREQKQSFEAIAALTDTEPKRVQKVLTRKLRTNNAQSKLELLDYIKQNFERYIQSKSDVSITDFKHIKDLDIFDTIDEVDDEIARLKAISSVEKTVVEPPIISTNSERTVKLEEKKPLGDFAEKLVNNKVRADETELKQLLKTLIKECSVQKEKNMDLKRKCQLVVRYMNKITSVFE